MGMLQQDLLQQRVRSMNVKSLVIIAGAVAVGTAAALAGGTSDTTTAKVVIVEVDGGRTADIQMSATGSTTHMKVVGAGAPAAGYRTDFSSTDGRLEVGIAVHDTVTLELSDWPIDEFMYFIEGQVEILDAEGMGRIYGPGDAIVMPKGFSGTWRQLGPLKKIAVVYSP